MSSAEGQVQHLGYIATFPLLLNIADQPTYFMALKDAAGLVKMYAMVNVSQYQIVSTGDTVADCEKNYRSMLAKNNLIATEDAVIDVVAGDTVEGTVAEIRSAVMGGDSQYFIRLARHNGNSVYYRISASACETAVILNVGDYVKITYEDGEGSILSATNVELAAAPEEPEAAAE